MFTGDLRREQFDVFWSAERGVFDARHLAHARTTARTGDAWCDYPRHSPPYSGNPTRRVRAVHLNACHPPGHSTRPTATARLTPYRGTAGQLRCRHQLESAHQSLLWNGGRQHLSPNLVYPQGD